jgi:cell migration-inducing and hyaluronan-binding protein
LRGVDRRYPGQPTAAAVFQEQRRDGIWSQECTNPACYGVPLYRQYLTGVDAGDAAKSTGEVKTWYANGCVGNKTTAACRFPFVRMGGQSTYQRSTLTVNHGTFFLDTTASENLQQHRENFSFVTNCDDTPAGKACSQRSVNVFQKGGTYYMFFLYAKRTTRQTYQIYVGQNFTYDLTYNKDAPTGMLRAIRPALTSMPVPT